MTDEGKFGPVLGRVHFERLEAEYQVLVEAVRRLERQADHDADHAMLRAEVRALRGRRMSLERQLQELESRLAS